MTDRVWNLDTNNTNIYEEKREGGRDLGVPTSTHTERACLLACLLTSLLTRLLAPASTPCFLEATSH